MKKSKYVVTVDLDLPPLKSGIEPYFTFKQFPNPSNMLELAASSLQRIWKLLVWAQHSELMVLDSTSGPLQPDLLACILMRFLKKRPLVILTGDMWNKGSTIKYYFQKMIVRMADASIRRYVVQSKGEQDVFSEVWGVDPTKVRLCLYSVTFTNEEIHAGEISARGYIFAGGNPNRDYDLLLKTAHSLPDRKFIIATRLLDGRKDIPSNVKVVKVAHHEFVGLMREADAVITPIHRGLTRAAGQQTYLNAMRMGKISIVNGREIFGVTDYIQNHVNGIITDGTPQGFSDAIEWIYDPANQDKVAEIKEKARKRAMEFTYDRHIDVMASIIEEAVAEAGI